jgi:uncharacterized protein (TIGR00251 family)
LAPSEPAWRRRQGDDWLLELHVQPGAKASAVVGEHAGRLKLKIAAPAVDNKANAALLCWLAAQFCVPKSAVRLVRGETSRKKTVAIRCDHTPWRELQENHQS